MPVGFFFLLILALIHWLISWYVLHRHYHAQPNRAFALFAFSVGLWTVAIAFAHHMPRGTTFFTRLAFLTGTLLVFAFVRMAFVTGDAYASWHVIRRFFIPITVIFSVLAPTSYTVVSATLIDTHLVVHYGLLYTLYAAHAIAYLVSGLSLLIYRYRLSSGLAKARLRYLLIGLFLPILGAATTNLLMPLLFKRSYIGFYGPLFAVVFFLCTAHAFIRYRLLDVTLVIRRGATWVLALLASLLPLLLSLGLLWPVFSARFRPVELALVLIASMVIGLLIPIMRDIAARGLDKYVYRSRTNYQKTLKGASRLLTKVLNLRDLLQLIGKAIVESTGSSFVSVFLKGQDGQFRCVATVRVDDFVELPTVQTLPPNILRDLLTTKETLMVEQHAQALGHDSELSCALFLPIITDDDLIGSVALGIKRSGDPFYSQDIDLLSTLANQAGVAIKNAQLYEQVVLINEYLQNIVGTIESGVIAVNQSDRITIFNRAAEQLTGLGADAVFGRSVAELPPPLGEPLRATAADGGQRVLAEVELPRPDGSRLPVICLTSALREPDGGLLGAVAVFSDLTPLKQLETERRRAERLAYFETLAAGIAHEIKNPLVAVKTFTQLLPRKFQDEQFRERFGRVVGREIDRMEHLVDRLRTLAKPAGRPHHPLDLRAPITDALELLQPRLDEKSIATVWTPGTEPRSVLGDHDALEQLFLNLFINALEAMEPGGRLAVRLSGPEGRTIVEIDDTGPGVPEDLQARIFDPFVTTKLHGSGLGLAICASIANAHRARIHVANKSGGSGALFTIEFPAEAMAPTPVTA